MLLITMLFFFTALIVLNRCVSFNLSGLRLHASIWSKHTSLFNVKQSSTYTDSTDNTIYGIDQEAWADGKAGVTMHPMALGRYRIAPETVCNIYPTVLPMVQEGTVPYEWPNKHHIKVDSDGLVHPRVKDKRGDFGHVFKRMSMFERDLFDEYFEADAPLTILHKGAILPPDLLLIRSHWSYYCIEPRIPMTLANYNSNLTQFINTLRIITRTEYNEELWNKTYEAKNLAMLNKTFD